MKIDSEELTMLRESFDYNDGDGNGKIDFDEFRTMLRDLETHVNVEQARIGFREIDGDRDGAIEFDEFVDWWREL